MWNVRLKDGRQVAIRFLVAEDKEKLVEMFSAMSDEALRWGLPPYTRERIEVWIGNIQNLIPLIAEHDNRAVGYASIFKFTHARRRGVGDLVIYLHQDFHNVGLGTAMLNRLLELARENSMHRLSLYVVADNKIAVRLYQKFGFRVEGVMKDAYLSDNQKYHDEIVMGLILT